MKAPQDIILRPIITENSMMGISGGKYTFKVAPDANKIEIAQAVEALFHVTVTKVNTINCKGRAKRVGMNAGYKSDWKKAIVTVKEGDSIEFFESMM